MYHNGDFVAQIREMYSTVSFIKYYAMCNNLKSVIEVLVCMSGVGGWVVETAQAN